jgi:glutamate-1-semialdehyde aminotransferase
MTNNLHLLLPEPGWHAALRDLTRQHGTLHTTELGGELADGIAQAIRSAGLPWTVIRFGPRSGQWYGPEPRTGADAYALTDDQLTRLVRIWLANRGIWEALPGAGPTVLVPATRADVTRYVNAYAELLSKLR